MPESLRDLEFEHETGKIDEADYRALRSRYAAAAIAARDAGAAGERDHGRGGAAGPTCGVCEAEVGPGAKFCSRCGTALFG